MKQTLLTAAVLATLGCMTLMPPAQAAVANSATNNLAASTKAANSSAAYKTATNNTAALSQLARQIEALPALSAARANVRAAELNLKAAGNAVYNPELGLGYQNADTDSYNLSVSQTFDWGDKKQAAQNEALLMLRRAEAELELSQSALWAEALSAMVAQQQTAAVLGFQTEQRELARAQLRLATERKRAGLISGGELSLIELDLAALEAAVSLATQAAIEADTRLLTLFGTLELPRVDMAELLAQSPVDIDEAAISRLPALERNYQDVQLSRLGADKLRASTSADPTLTLGAEKEGSDNKLGLNLSIPLKVRNNYSDAIAAATEAGIGAEQQYLASERALTQAWRQYQYAQPKLAQSWQSWQMRVKGSASTLGSSLASQWQAGEISTSDFLQGKRQLAQSFIAGTELEARLYQNWLDWVGQSGLLASLMPSGASVEVTTP
ncbi:TolC family protein [Shewanella sp. JM162201]|uniref:TolC family protein n=1 Tax=Shewanella jiangmenensis TaxID=2837387 RepID=A0ABS5V9J3_9GAMM|nr:TolC family protein [Shewanella jiangmenensis]MBT1446404.1 TolC family protein [Shewanella jiangmenensis]